jgi:hypothetical protein
METSLALLDEMKIRRTLHNNEWWFAVDDVVGALTESLDPGEYLRKMRRSDRGPGQMENRGARLDLYPEKVY